MSRIVQGEVRRLGQAHRAGPEEAPGGRIWGPEETPLPGADRTRWHDPGSESRQVLEESFCDLLLECDHIEAMRRLHIRRRIGSGSQGVVLEAWHTGYLSSISRHALKVFEPSVYASRRAYEQDLLRIAGQLTVLQPIYHPNLVHLEDFYHFDGVGILEMELVDGLDLRSLMRREEAMLLDERVSSVHVQRLHRTVLRADRRALHPCAAVYILRHVLRGLAAMHARGYIHGDIKPANIMLDRCGSIKLVDFGRAVAIDDPRGLFLGSPLYMAPEVQRLEAMTPRSDLYSAGLVLLELLRGEPLCDPLTDEAVILAAKLTLMDRLQGLLPPEVRSQRALVELLRHLLAVKAEDRFADAEEADAGREGALRTHTHLSLGHLITDYGHELQVYMEAVLPPPTPVAR